MKVGGVLHGIEIGDHLLMRTHCLDHLDVLLVAKLLHKHCLEDLIDNSVVSTLFVFLIDVDLRLKTGDLLLEVANGLVLVLVVLSRFSGLLIVGLLQLLVLLLQLLKLLLSLCKFELQLLVLGLGLPARLDLLFKLLQLLLLLLPLPTDVLLQLLSLLLVQLRFEHQRVVLLQEVYVLSHHCPLLPLRTQVLLCVLREKRVLLHVSLQQLFPAQRLSLVLYLPLRQVCRVHFRVLLLYWLLHFQLLSQIV